MKKIFLLVLSVSLALSGWSQILTEPFNYTPDATLGLGAQSAGAWTIINTGDSILVSSGSLSYTGLPASTGNKVKFDGGGTDYYTSFAAQTTGSVYSSFILNVSALGTLNTTSGYFAGMLQASSTSSFGATVWTRLSTTAGKYNVGISTRSNSAVTWLATDLTPGTPCFIVTAYDILSGTANDVARIWLNTSAIGAAEPTADATAVAGTDLAAAGIGRYFLRQDATATTPFIEFDELRVGTTWTSVTPSGTAGPTLSATTLTGFGNVCLNTTSTPNSFTITGSNLTAGNITVAALTGFAYSTTSGGTYTPTLTIAETGTVNQTVYVEFTPTAVQSYNGNIGISGGGAAAINVAATGSGINTLATVTTAAATGVTSSGATIPGTITATGCGTISAYGAEYSITPGFANGTGTAVPSSNLTTGSFTAALTGLAASTTYYYHTYATNSAGPAYSSELNFTTTAAATPVLSATTLTAFGNICVSASGGPNSFTITGANLTAGNITVAALSGYSYSTTSGGLYTSTLTIAETGSVSQQVFVKFDPTTVQSYNGNIGISGGGATAVNVAASGAGVNTIATVTTAAATGITTTTATVPGTITANGCTTVTAYGVEYSITPGFTNGTGTAVSSTNIAAGAFTSALSGLTAATTYYYHAYATNGGGTAYSAEQSFTTSVVTITSGLVISQVYGAGGNTGATYNADYVELKNITTGPLSTAGLSIQYGSATQSGNWSVYALPTATIPAGGFYLIQMSATGATGSALPTPDATASPTISMAAAAGRVALVSGTTALANCPTSSAYLDLVGYGTTATCFEGTGTAAAPSATLADFRKNNGCQDTNDNTADFDALTPAPRNSATAVAVCGAAVPTLSATTLTAFGNVCLNTASTPNSFTITGSNLTAGNVTVAALAGYAYSTTAGGTYTATLTIAETGSVNQQVFVELTPTAVQSYSGNIGISGGGATAINVAASGAGVNTIATVTSAAATGVTSSTATVPGTITANGCSAVTAYGVEYSLTPGFVNGTGTAVASTNIAAGSFTSALSGLTASTTYYYHAYATNGGGTAYSSELNFTTTAAATPVLSATALTAFGNVCVSSTGGPNSFTITGSNLTAGNITVAALSGFSYSTTSGGLYTSTLTIAETGTLSQQVFVKFDPTTVQSYNGNIGISGGGATALNVAASGAGVNTIATVTTAAATGISISGATVPGTITANGCTTVTAYGIEYSTTLGFPNGTGTAVASTNLAAGSFTSALTGLAAATTYYYHAYAINGGGTAYSSELNFTTTGSTLTTGLVISQLYGAGGNSGATYNADYVELKNITTGPLSTAGLSIQYGSAAQSGNWAVYALPAATIPAGGFYLIQMSTTGATGSALPTPDATASPAIAMAAAAGRVALVNGTTALANCPAAASYIDLVGYGTATCFEGTGTAAAPSATLADFRKNNGCQDTNDNTADFDALTPAPRNSATAVAVCGAAVPTLSATTLTAFGNVCLNTTTAANSFTITGSNLTAGNITVAALAGYTYSTTSGGTYTATLTIAETGSVNQQVFVKFTPTAVQSYNGNIGISGGGATAINVTASGAGVNTLATVTASAAGATSTGATIPGTITATGCGTITAYGAEYSLTPGFANGTGTAVPASNLTSGAFTALLTGLTPSTTYYYHTYSTNSGGTAYSSELNFTTTAAATPVLSATALTAFGNVCLNTTTAANSFTITGSNLTAGNITVAALAGYTYSLTSGGTYTTTLTIAETGTLSQQVFVKFTPTAVQSYNGNIAISGGGATAINVAASGAGVNTIATVTSAAATGITTSGATVPGTISATGCTAVTAYGVEYSITPGFANGTGTAVASTNIAAGSFTSALTGLAASTTYYYHAYATNGGGTAYSSELNFTTSGSTLTTGLVISQVYGAGGNATATYNADYVEIKNITGGPLSTAGLSIQYGSAGVTGPWSGVYALPAATIPAGGFYLIQMSATGTVGAALPTPDATATPTISMAAAAGRVALVNGTTALTGCPASGSYLDLVGYGTTATCFEGTTGPAAAPSAVLADFRKNNGCQDTNDNAGDFDALLPAPRNSATTPISCTAATLSATALTAFGNVCVNTTAGPNSFTITGSNLTAGNITVAALAGYTYSTTSGGTYTATLTIAETGTLSQQVFVKFTPTAVQSYNGNIAISGGGATTINVAASGAGVTGAPIVTSAAATGVTATGATVPGTITSTGCTTVTAYGVEYSTTPGFANGTGTAVASANLAAGSFTSALSGLTPATIYYYHAYATNGAGTGYSAELNFTTLAGASPSLSATALTAFGNVCVNTTAGPNSFTLTGSNLTAGNITVAALAGYTYSTTSGGTYTATLTIAETGTLSQQVFVKFTPTAVQSYSGNIGISGGGATATNVAASGAGVNSTPTVTSGAASAITTTTATVAGTITANGCTTVTAYGIEYSTTSGFPNGTGTAIASTNIAAGAFTSALTGLTAGVTYYYHAYATNGGGTGYGAELSFTTLSGTTTTSGLVISQLYGSGGNSGATFNADYVEIKNITTGALSTAGLSIQYGSAAVAGTWSGVYALPSATIPAGGFYLIQMSAAGTTGAALPTPDAIATTPINMSGTAGRVALVNGTTALSACPASSSYMDLVGYGTATCFEGSGTAAAPSATNADFRKNNGCQDTNDNTADFDALAAAPRNSATTAISCGSSTSPNISTTALTAFGNVCVNATAGPNSFTINGTNLSTANVVVGPLAGYTFSTTAGGTYTPTLTLTQTGGTYTQQIFVQLTPTAVQSYNGNIPVSGGGLTATVNVAASGAGINTIASVTSGAASAITANSATVAGSIPSTGCSAITAYGVEYSTTNGFPNGSGTPVASTNLAGGNFTSALSGLAPSTTYYYHAFATNSGGTAYGAQLSFTTTAPTSPTLFSTAPAAFGNVCVNTTAGPNSFTVSGVLLTNATITVGPLANYTFSTTAGGTYTASLTLPQAGGTYSQQVFIKFTPTAVQSYNGNIPVSGGGATAINVSVTGAGVNSAPTVTSGAASAITQTTATVAGTIPSGGCSAVTAYGIEYSTTAGFANGTGTAVPATNLTGVNFSSALTGLTVATTYYYHAYATNGGGTGYGAQQSFTTSAAVLTASTISASFGNVCTGNTAGPNSFTITSNAVSAANINVSGPAGYTFSASSGGPYTSTLSLTHPAGAYSQVIYVNFTPTAVQSYNGNIVVSGGGATTSVNVPVTGSGINTAITVATGAATNITANSATIAGVVTNSACHTASVTGIEYSSIRGFANGTGNHVPSTGAATNFTVTLTGLVPNSVYYFHAYGVSGTSTVYGAIDSFKTARLMPGMVIYSNPIVRGGQLHFSIDSVPPAHYVATVINNLGQEVFSQGIIVQVGIGFMDNSITIPGFLPSGTYVLRIRNTNGTFKASHRFMLL